MSRTAIGTTRTAAGSRLLARNLSGALRFNGTNARVTVTYNPFSTPVTFAGWALRAAKTQSTLLGGVNSAAEPLIRIETNDDFGFWTNSDNPQTTWLKATPQPGQWFHWAMTYDGAAAILYINGVSKGTNSFSDTFNAPGNLVVGAWLNTLLQPWNGFQDDFMVFNSVLTPTQITNLYFNYVVPTTQLWYKFDEGSGTSATDSSGNSRTGTITNGTYITNVALTTRTAASTRTVA